MIPAAKNRPDQRRNLISAVAPIFHRSKKYFKIAPRIDPPQPASPHFFHASPPWFFSRP